MMLRGTNLTLAGTIVVAFGLADARGQCTLEETQQILASDGQPPDSFGNDVSIDGDLAAVGALWSNNQGVTGNGSVYVLRRSGGTWTETQELMVDEAWWLGTQVAASGDVIAAGTRAGAEIHVFQDGGGGFNLVDTLTDPENNPTNWFGWILDVSGDALVATASSSNVAATNAGAAWVFRDQGGQWVLEQQLTASNPEANEQFGISVAIDGDLIVVGALHSDGVKPDSGSAYVFRRVGGTWIEEAELKASDERTRKNYAGTVDVHGDVIVVGSPRNDEAGSNAGAAYVYDRNEGGPDNWGERSPS